MQILCAYDMDLGFKGERLDDVYLYVTTLFDHLPHI